MFVKINLVHDYLSIYVKKSISSVMTETTSSLIPPFKKHILS